MFIFGLLNSVSAAPPDEKELVEEVKAGNDDAFGEIVERYEKLVFNAACRVLSSSGRSTDAADEIAEDAFVKAWRNIRSFRGDCSLSTWLYRIAVNTAKDRLRSDARHASLSLTLSDEDDDVHEWDVPVTSGDTVPEDAVERQETIIAVRRAIEELPEDMRKVVVMRDINEMPYSDIAEILGIELGTVKSRLSRGRAALKKLLEDGNFI